MTPAIIAWFFLLGSSVAAALDSAKRQEPADAEVMHFGDDAEVAPADPEMTFEDEAVFVPVVPPVPTPPPAEQSLSVPEALDVRVAARRVVADHVRLVPIEIRAPWRLPGLRGTATMGELDSPELVEPGLYRAHLRLPAVQGPVVILVVFWTEERVGVARIQVWKKSTLEVPTEPGSRVRVEIGGETFGPVLAPGHRAMVEVEIPPGAHTARVIVIDAAGNETTQTMDLPQQRFRRSLVLPPAEQLVADDGPVLPVLVAVTDDAGGVPSDWTLEVESGAVGEPAEIQAGLRLYPWRPSRALGEKGLVVRLQDQVTERWPVQMIAGPPVGMEIQAVPSLLPADGRSTTTVYAGLSDGLGHYVDAGPVEMEVAGGTVIHGPIQTGTYALAIVAADLVLPGGEPPAAIVVTARAAGYEGVVAIRQFDPATRGIRLTPADSRLTADGESRTTVRVEVLDGLGDPLPESGSLTLFAMGGEVPPEIYVHEGVGSFEFRAGTTAGIASIRADREGCIGHTAITLEAGPPARLRAEVRAEEPAGRGRYVVRARLEDRYGNGVPAGADAAFRAGASRGTIEAFRPVEATGTEDVGWVEATLVLPAGETRPVSVRVEAGEWVETLQVDPPAPPVLYLALASGYAHNLGAAGVIPLRLGVGWIDAFGAAGLQFGAELGYNALRRSLEAEAGGSYKVQGDVLNAHLVVGYRWPVASWLVFLADAGLGMGMGWFEIDPPGASPNVTSDAVVTLSVAGRVVFGIPLGPGLVALSVAYDYARYDDLVRGNVGGLGALLGYRLEI